MYRKPPAEPGVFDTQEDKESWRSFLVWLKERGLDGVKLVVGDKNLGMCESVHEVFPEARYQIRYNIFRKKKKGAKSRHVSALLIE